MRNESFNENGREVWYEVHCEYEKHNDELDLKDIRYSFDDALSEIEKYREMECHGETCRINHAIIIKRVKEKVYEFKSNHE